MTDDGATITATAYQFNVASGITTQEAYISVGNGRTGSGYAYIDLIGDATYTDYGLRLIRNNTGQNAISQLIHRGTGDLQIRTEDAAPVVFYTNNSQKATIISSGEFLLGYTSSQGAYLLQVNGAVYATAYFESSDERLKNIAVAYQSENFGAIEFTWKYGRDSKNHWGYSAQQVKKYLPDAVNENSDGYLTVDYNQAHTFKIQKLEEKNKTLEEKIIDLVHKNILLEDKITNIK
jgi:hypothetical protein